MVAYGFDQYLTYTEMLGPYGAILQFGIMAGLVVLHEATHAVAYATVGGLSWDEIDVEVGGIDDVFAPLHHSVHPARPIRRSAYYAGVVAPSITLGFGPTMVDLTTGNPLAMFVGLVGLLLISTDISALVTAHRQSAMTAVSNPTY